MIHHLVARGSSSGGDRRAVLRLLLASNSHTQLQQQQSAAAAAAPAGRAAGYASASSSSYAQQQQDSLSLQDAEAGATPFDAQAESAPLRAHQLIGDPRTGIADDTTTAPFSNDIQVEHVWQSDTKGTEWYRYSMAGQHLPYMHMDSRLSDHSKNLMYMLRAKDPQRWTIPALAAKFRIRRQRVMAILALKEIQAHKISQGASLQGPLQHFAFRVPLSDLQLDAQGQPVDLLQLVKQQEAQQQQQKQRQQTTAAAAAAAVDPLQGAEGLGSLQDFLAPEAGAQQAQHDAAAAAAGDSSGSSIGIGAVDQQADLAVLMPQVALTAQQLQMQLLRLLQSHHYSMQALQAHLLEQIDAAEAYYKAHIAGTPLEQALLQQTGQQKQKQNTPAAAAADDAADTADQQPAEDADAAAGSAAPPAAWLDFAGQRQAVQRLMQQLQVLLDTAGPQLEREAGRLLVQLRQALEQQAAGAPEAAAAAEGAADGQQQPASEEGLAALVEGSDPQVLVAAFNQLAVAHRQQLVDAVGPALRIKLNIQGADLRAALADSTAEPAAAAASSSSSSGSGSAGSEVWPGQVPPLVDVWGFAEVPREQLAALQAELPGVQQVLDSLQQLSELTGSAASSSSKLRGADIGAVQQSVQVYSGLLRQYDEVLNQQLEQAAAASSPSGARGPSSSQPPAALLPPSAQRRLVRILREVDPNAVEKLLLWETVFKEGAERRVDQRRLNKLKMRVAQRIRELDEAQQATSLSGRAPPPLSAEYPDLPANLPAEQRRDRDMWAAQLEAEVVGRQFHRGSGDRPFVSVPTYPRFEGATLEEFDGVVESEISVINRLAAERQDNMMWKEYRVRLLRNMGLLAPDLHQHSGVVKPPKPAEGWSWVVHPVGGSAKALNRQQLRQARERQWLDDDAGGGGGAGAGADSDDEQQQRLMDLQAQGWGSMPAPTDPARGPAPQAPYVAEPGGRYRQLNEEEALVVADTRPQPRKRYGAGKAKK